MLALAVIESPSDTLSRKNKITHARLQYAGVLAAERTKRRVKDALQKLAMLRFRWNAHTKGQRRQTRKTVNVK